MCLFRVLEAQQYSNYHHADAETSGTEYHRFTPAKSVDKEGWKEAAHDEHDLDATSENESKIPCEADVVFEDSGDEIDDQIYSTWVVSATTCIG